jgi:hypothetical protein
MSAETNESVQIPEFFRQAQDIYNLVYDQAVRDDNDDLVYRGKITRIFAEVGVPNNDYAKVRAVLFRALSEVDGELIPCLLQIRRGAGGSPSIVVVLREPLLSDLEAPEISGSLLTYAQRRARVVADTDRRITDLEDKVMRILRNFESRLRELEAKAQG